MNQTAKPKFSMKELEPTREEITVAWFKNNITRGYELLVTDEGVPGVPIGIVFNRDDATLFANAYGILVAAREMLDANSHLNDDTTGAPEDAESDRAIEAWRKLYTSVNGKVDDRHFSKAEVEADIAANS